MMARGGCGARGRGKSGGTGPARAAMRVCGDGGPWQLCACAEDGGPWQLCACAEDGGQRFACAEGREWGGFERRRRRRPTMRVGRGPGLSARWSRGGRRAAAGGMGRRAVAVLGVVGPVRDSDRWAESRCTGHWGQSTQTAAQLGWRRSDGSGRSLPVARRREARPVLGSSDWRSQGRQPPPPGGGMIPARRAARLRGNETAREARRRQAPSSCAGRM